MRGRRGLPLLQLILTVLALGSLACSDPEPSARPDAGAGDGAGLEGPAGPATVPAEPPPGAHDGAAVGPEVTAAAWRRCGAGLECTEVAVPLDHDDPDGPTTEVALIRVPASDPARRRGSLFVNPGGPGASGVDMVRNGFRFDADTMARYDLIGFDPRGVGGSEPLGCSPDLTSEPLPDPHPDDAGEREELDRFARAVAQRCAETDGDRLAHLDTDHVTRDLDLLRRAVGDDELSYYGLSYGTFIGLRYLDLFPDRVGRMVLDGVVDPQVPLVDQLAQQAEAFDRAFAEMAQACGAAADCPPQGLDSAYDDALSRVEAGPVDGVGPAEVATAAAMATYDAEIWGVLRQALARAVTAGDFSTLEALNDRYHEGASFAAYLAVSCTDTPVPRGAAEWDAFTAELASLSPRFGAAIASELRPCAHWPVTADVRPGPVRAAGSAPVLVIGTTGDAATPVENAVAVAEQLEQGRLLVHEGRRHTAYGDPCVDAAVRTYLLDGLLPAPGSRC